MRQTLTGLAFGALLLLPGLAAADEARLRVVILDGQNNHNWRGTTPILKQALEKSGRFTVDVSSHLKEGDKPGTVKETVPFPPDLDRYDVVLSNYNGSPWPEAFQKSLDEHVKAGKVGLTRRCQAGKPDLRD